MKKLKKLVSIAASVCIISGCAYGAELNINYQDGCLSINGKDFDSSTVGMSVLPANSATDGSSRLYAAILELEVNKNNGFDRKINMPQTTQNGIAYPSGYYDVSVHDSTMTHKNETFLFVNESVASAALRELSQSNTTIDTLNTYRSELGISDDLSNSDINNDKLVSYFNMFKPQTDITPDTFSRAYISALLCGGMEYSFDDFMITLRGNRGVLKCDGNKFFGIDKSIQEKVYKKINRDFSSSATEFDLILEEAAFIEQINAENDDEVYAQLINTDYKNFLNLNMSTYNSLKSPESVILSLMDTEFLSVEQFKEAFRNAVENQKNAEYSWNSGASSGGSGGGSSSGKFDGAYVPQAGQTSAESTTEIFYDMKNHWAKDAVYYLKNKGIVDGTGNNNFTPDNKVTRAEFAKMIHNSLVPQTVIGTMEFNDVKSADWFYTYVCALGNAGLINGTGDGSFAPHAAITRQDAAVIIKRTLDYKKVYLQQEREAVIFSDDSAISDYAKDAVDALYKSKLINGRDDMSFAPYDGLTRAEAAQMIYNILYKGVV